MWCLVLHTVFTFTIQDCVNGCVNGVARHPGDVGSATTGVERRPVLSDTSVTVQATRNLYFFTLYKGIKGSMIGTVRMYS